MWKIIKRTITHGSVSSLRHGDVTSLGTSRTQIGWAGGNANWPPDQEHGEGLIATNIKCAGSAIPGGMNRVMCSAAPRATTIATACTIGIWTHWPKQTPPGAVSRADVAISIQPPVP